MKKIFVFGMSIMFLWSCNNSNKTSKTLQEAETENHTENHQAVNAGTIELNNGEKWLVNEEMKPFVLKGETLVNTYIQKDQTDHKALAEQLKEQNSLLIKSCTMTGKSHDELHNWLHPHLKIVKNLEDETDTEKANDIVLQLQNSYQEYHEHFN